MSYTAATRSTRPSPPWPPGHARSRAAGTSSSQPATASRRCRAISSRIHRVGELGDISVDDGASSWARSSTTPRSRRTPTCTPSWTGLADGSALVGSPATRYVGTIGGNIMNSSPAMDTGAPLLVLGAEVELRSKDGSRTVPVSELWTGPGRTSAGDGELLVSVRVPAPPARSGSAYLRLEYRRAMEIAVVGAAAFVTLNGDGDVEACRIALTAVAPTIVRSAARRPRSSASPSTRRRSPPWPLPRAPTHRRSRTSARGERYRRHTVGVMARRAVETAAARARGEHVSVPANRASGIGAPLGG